MNENPDDCSGALAGSVAVPFPINEKPEEAGASAAAGAGVEAPMKEKADDADAGFFSSLSSFDDPFTSNPPNMA
jgi:hypothetical protein